MGIKQYFQKVILKRSDSPREKKFYSFDTARSVGIVFPVIDEASEETFKILKEALKKYAIPFSGVAVEATKIPVNMFWCISSPNMTVINKKDINWLGMLSNEENISSFLATRYDIAVNMSADPDDFTCKYLIRRTAASFKIGYGQKDDPAYDMVIRPDEGDDSFTQKELAEEIVHLLSSIKSK